MDLLKKVPWPVVFVLSLFLAAGCATDAPSVHKLLEMQPESAVSAKSQQSSDYIIKTRDTIEVNVWKEPEFSGTRVVRDDGKITLALIGDVKAAGLTTSQLAEEIKKKLKAYIEYPEVSVSLVSSRPFRIYILGEVNQQGEYEIREGMRLMQAISMAGGLNEWAKKSEIILVRKIKGKEMRFKIDFNAIVNGTDLKQNILLKEGDTIIVP